MSYDVEPLEKIAQRYPKRPPKREEWPYHHWAVERQKNLHRVKLAFVRVAFYAGLIGGALIGMRQIAEGWKWPL